jgi:hypothetical protein
MIMTGKKLLIFLAIVLLLSIAAGCGNVDKGNHAQILPLPGEVGDESHQAEDGSILPEADSTAEFIGFTTSVNGFTIYFNEAERSTMRGSQVATHPDAFSEEISVYDADIILGIDLLKCIPASLYDLSVFVEAGYVPSDELSQLNIWIHDPEQEPGSALGRTLVLSVNSRSWSEHSHPLARIEEDIWNPKSHEATFIHDVLVVFRFRPPTIGFDNAVYTAFFIIENDNYDDSETGAVLRSVFGMNVNVMSRMGVTDREFAEFVIDLIRSFTLLR